MPRVVEAETLDHLPPDDPAAVRSRRDLVRVHRVMRTRSIVCDGWEALVPPPSRAKPLRILELGAGDGRLLLGVAQRLATRWPPVQLTLLDRLDIVSRATLEGYAALGWRAQVLVMDVLGGRMKHTMAIAARRTRSCRRPARLTRPTRPQGRKVTATRSRAGTSSAPPCSCTTSTPLLCAVCWLQWLPAPTASLRSSPIVHGPLGGQPPRGPAGRERGHARGRGAERAGRLPGPELAEHWPTAAGWHLHECRAGLFSHVFRAVRTGPAA
jgi:hypothetical protein